jgi:putative hydrolase of HD superfamily
MVADAMYLADVDAKEDERTVYNDFYTALFHDLPEVLTKDVISPIKASIGGLESILQEYEHEQIDNVIMPLLNPDWRDEFRFMVYDPFHDEEGGRFGRRKGYDIKTCDLYAAYMEAMISRSYGVTSNSLAQGETQLREKLMSRKGLDAKALVEGLGKMQI